jgi:hypothetical protein
MDESICMPGSARVSRKSANASIANAHGRQRSRVELEEPLFAAIERHRMTAINDVHTEEVTAARAGPQVGMQGG